MTEYTKYNLRVLTIPSHLTWKFNGLCGAEVSKTFDKSHHILLSPAVWGVLKAMTIPRIHAYVTHRCVACRSFKYRQSGGGLNKAWNTCEQKLRHPSGMTIENVACAVTRRDGNRSSHRVSGGCYGYGTRRRDATWLLPTCVSRFTSGMFRLDTGASFNFLLYKSPQGRH